MPFNQIATSVSIFSSGLIGYNAISLTTPTNPAIAPKIAAGSSVEIAGAFFSATEDIIINASSWSAIANNTDAYILLTPSGTAGSQIITASYTTTHPVWSTSKQGWYASAGSVIRCIGGLRKTTAGYSYQSIFYSTGFEQGNKKNALNTQYGYSALSANTTGYNDSAFGVSALASNTIGNSNSAFGFESLRSNVSGTYNSAFGVSALASNTIGNSNSAFGTGSLSLNTTGTSNSAFGFSSLGANTTGYNDSAFGVSALASNTIGTSNSAFGVNSLSLNTTGTSNSAFGYNSLSQNTTGYNNSSFGINSLLQNTTGISNSAFGTNSLFANTTGISNSAFGTDSLVANTTGYNNSAFGFGSLKSNVSGTYNSAFGYNSLSGIVGVAFANTAIGYNAGSNITTGSLNTCLGSGANPSSPTASWEVTLGDSNIVALRCQATSITSLSDKRDKKNIEPLPLGIDFINKLKPSIWNFDRRDWYENGISDGSKVSDKKSYGFIAQDFQDIQKEYGVDLGLVLESNPDKLEATPGNLLPILIKAVQELSSRIEYLEKQIKEIK